MVVREAYKKGFCPICGCTELTQEDNPRNYDRFVSIPFSCNNCAAYVGYWFKRVRTCFGVPALEYTCTQSLRLDEWDTDDEEIKRQLDMLAPIAARHFK
jgi:hypothetical protein